MPNIELTTNFKATTGKKGVNLYVSDHTVKASLTEKDAEQFRYELAALVTKWGFVPSSAGQSTTAPKPSEPKPEFLFFDTELLPYGDTEDAIWEGYSPERSSKPKASAPSVTSKGLFGRPK